MGQAKQRRALGLGPRTKRYTVTYEGKSSVFVAEEGMVVTADMFATLARIALMESGASAAEIAIVESAANRITVTPLDG